MQTVAGIMSKPTIQEARWPGLLAIGIATLLLTSAVLKTEELATTVLPPGHLFENRWLILLVVEWEFLLAAWMLSRVATRAAWLATTVTFAGFLGVTLYKALAGDQSCGCFGQVQVNPWITLGLDATVLSLLLLMRPDLRASPPPRPWPRNRILVAAWCVALVGAVAAVETISFEPARLLAGGQVAADAQVVVLDPGEWVGQRFPLSSYVTLEQPVMQGPWVVVIYRHGCQHCLTVFAELNEQLQRHPPGPTTPRIAAIEMAPYATAGQFTPRTIPGVHHGQLDAARDWFVTTPVVAALRDGRVVLAKEEASFQTVQEAIEAAGPAPLPELAGVRYDLISFTPFAAGPEDDTAWFEQVQPVPGTPVARVADRQGSYNFGDVRTESIHGVLFEMTNPGRKPLRISSIKAECVCLQTRPGSLVIPPGGTAQVLVGFKAPQSAMHYQNRVLLMVEKAPPIILTLTAEVR